MYRHVQLELFYRAGKPQLIFGSNYFVPVLFLRHGLKPCNLGYLHMAKYDISYMALKNVHAQI